jgi:triacylglycerol lipase
MQHTINNNITGYDAQNALSLAHLSALAYQDKGQIYAQLTQWQYPQHAFFTNKPTGTQGFVAANDQNVVLAFRGTEITRINDLVTDAKIGLVAGPYGQVHQGFETALSSVWDDITAKIAEFRHNQQSIWITGHSLGGALATLAAARLVKTGTAFNAVYNYGCPRVGDKEFASQFDQVIGNRCFRVRNNNDIVTRIPVAGIFFYRYRHTQKLVYFDSQGVRRDSIGWWGLMREHIKGHINDFGDVGIDDLEDHKIKQYLQVLAADLGH